MTAPAVRWVFACDVYVAGPYKSEAAADRALAATVKLGICQRDHVVRPATPRERRR